MSFQSKVIYTGDGEQYQYTITFPFISSSHVRVYINEVLMLEPLNYTRSGSTITFNSIPEQDDAIVIQRWTSPTAILVDFEDGSTLRADDLDTSYLHNFYLSQEYADSFNELINETLINIASGTGILETETDAVIAALVNEMLNTEQAATIQQRVTDIDNNAEAILSLADSLQVQINTLAQGVAANVYLDDDEPVPGVPPYPDPIAEGARWYDTNDNNHPYIYQSSAWVSIEDNRIGQAAADIQLLSVSVENNYAAILAEQFVQATESFATAQSLSILGASNADGSAFIIDLDTALIDSDQGVSLASRFTSLDSSIAGNTSSITTEQTTRANADAAIADTVKIDTDGGDTLATRFSGLSAADSTNAADISTEETARISGDAANASSISTVSATVDGHTTSITTNASAISSTEGDVTNLQARYGVSLNVNGYVTGFLQHNDGSSGEFVILADKFAVVDPSGDAGETEYVPFQIVGGKVRFNANVEIDGNLMVSGTINGSSLINGTIGSTQIGANAITTTQLNADSVNASHIQANAVTASEINVTNLAAMSADMGALTAGSIALATTGFIRGGQTAYNTGNGFWVGYDSAQYKLSIGNGGANALTWDGTTLKVIGEVIVGTWIASATNLVNNMSVEDTGNTAGYLGESATYKQFTVDRDGTVSLYLSGYYTGPSGPKTEDAQNYWDTEEPRIVVYINDVFEDEAEVSARYASYGGVGPIQLPVSAGDVVKLTVKGGRWWDFSHSVWRTATAVGGYCKVYAEVDLTTGANTINLDS
jgi:hypothetical protein